MSTTLYKRASALALFAAAVSLAGKEGYFYKLDENNEAILCTAATDVPHGLTLAVSDDGLEITGAVMGAIHGTVGVKLGAAVTDLRKALSLRADAKAESDDAAGARVLVAMPLETGAADEIIECALIDAKLIGNPVTLTSTNGTMAAALDDAAVKVEGEKIGDDVRAIYAALQANGTLA